MENMKDRIDSWIIEYKYEDNGETIWTPIGLSTASLEEATDWLSTVARLNTTFTVRDRAGIETTEARCLFRLYNATTKEVIPGEIFVNG